MTSNTVLSIARLSIFLPLIAVCSNTYANDNQDLLQEDLVNGYSTEYRVTKTNSKNVKFISTKFDKDLDILDSSILDTPVEESVFPNSVRGVKEVARPGDYVMLKGYFFSKADELVYEFHDEQEDALFVEFDEIPENFMLGEYFLLWAKVTKNEKQTFIKGLSLSN